MKTRNIFVTADSYKYGHSKLLPKNCISQYNYMAGRGGKYEKILANISLQYYIKEFLLQVPIKQEAIRFEKLAAIHGVPFDRPMWDYIIELGFYPLEIKAIPEGTLIPNNVVSATFESTDPRAVGIVGFIETLFMKVWFGTSVATLSYNIKQTLLKYGSSEWAEYALHHFGARSASSEESSVLSGYAHLTQFKGTDSFGALPFCEDYYNQPIDQAAGHSVIATEHSIQNMNSAVLPGGEEQFVYETILNNPNSNILSFVGDSYDIFKFTEFCTNQDSRIRALIESRPNQKLVIRPDSGNAIEVLEKLLEILYSNDVEMVQKTRPMLFKQFGLLWGDGIASTQIKRILDHTDALGYAAENFVFGMGTGLSHGSDAEPMNRDTQKFAVKCSSITIKENIYGEEDGSTIRYGAEPEDIDVFKDPITDPGKASKRGKVTTWYDTETRQYVDGTIENQPNMHCVEALVTVFRNGKLLIDDSLETIRNRS